MSMMLRLVAAVLAGSLSFADTGRAQDASRWADSFHSRARLVAGGGLGNERLAGVEIVLDPGFKTYWRDPGESGLPPRFDWTGSRNAEAIVLSWPAPTRTEDAGGTAHIYSQRVVFPLRVKASDPAQAVTVHLNLDYGVCKDICIPAQAALELALETGDGPYRGLIEQSLARVPRPQPLGEQGPLSITSVETVAAEKSTYLVRVRAPHDAMLFAEPPENWYLSTSRQQPGSGFTITVEERPKQATGPVPLRLTLVAGAQAIETQVLIDASLASR